MWRLTDEQPKKNGRRRVERPLAYNMTLHVHFNGELEDFMSHVYKQFDRKAKSMLEQARAKYNDVSLKVYVRTVDESDQFGNQFPSIMVDIWLRRQETDKEMNERFEQQRAAKAAQDAWHKEKQAEKAARIAAEQKA